MKKTTKPSSQDTPILAATRHLVQPNGSIVGRDVAAIVRANHATFLSAITAPSKILKTRAAHPALASIDGRASLSHDRVVEFGQSFGPMLHQMGIRRGDRIALVLPNGPELALALVAVANWATAVPLNANGAASELKADLLRCGACLVIGPGGSSTSSSTSTTPIETKFHVPSAAASRSDWAKAFGFVKDVADSLDIKYASLVPSDTEAGIFSLETTHKSTATGNPEPNQYNDAALVLFTSGTTGNKKLVPHNMGDLLTAAATIALSWDLTAQDVNCNLMPLFHVGGIVRQVFSPMISGGCVICCPAFDPSIFWELLQKKSFTWYYAAPTMHHLILQTGKSEGFIGPNMPKLILRMIANAAGGLLPSLAEEMRATFDANVRIQKQLFSKSLTCIVLTCAALLYRSTIDTGASIVWYDRMHANLFTTCNLPVGEAWYLWSTCWP